jgi:hypothetical protein
METFKDRTALEKYIDQMIWIKGVGSVAVTLGKALDDGLRADIRHIYEIKLVDPEKFVYLFTKKFKG